MQDLIFEISNIGLIIPQNTSFVNKILQKNNFSKAFCCKATLAFTSLTIYAASMYNMTIFKYKVKKICISLTYYALSAIM